MAELETRKEAGMPFSLERHRDETPSSRGHTRASLQGTPNLFVNSPIFSPKGDLKEKTQCKARSWLCPNFEPIPKTTRIISKFEVYLFFIRYYDHMVLNLKGIKEHKTEKNQCLFYTFCSAALFSSPDKSSVTSFLYIFPEIH